MSVIKEMIEEAKEIEKYCNQSYSSDREALQKQENFKQKYHRNWVEVITEFNQNFLKNF